MAWDKDKDYLFTGGVDMKVRSWVAEIGSEAKVFEGATRSVCFLLVRGNIRKCSWCTKPVALQQSFYSEFAWRRLKNSLPNSLKKLFFYSSFFYILSKNQFTPRFSPICLQD